MSVIMILMAHLPVLAVAGAVIAAAISFIDAAFALRAKRRMRRLIKTGAGHGSLVRDLRESDLGAADSERARKVIMQAANYLSARDRQFVVKGIDQASRSGERRFIRELMSP